MKTEKRKLGDKPKRATASKLKVKLQGLVNTFIRERDSKDGYFTCISCGKVKSVDHLQAGHYIPVSKSQFLRFNEDNIHGECDGCNCFNEFHLVPYRKNLIKKIGINRVEFLEKQMENVPLCQWKTNELEVLIEHYKKLNGERK